VTRGFAPTIGLLTALLPAAAHAQTNLDQGKSASQIFATDCVQCHKAAHGLANGRNNAALTDFLREHYTTSREQAAALASYVLGGRGTEPIGGSAQGQGKKQTPARASASAEEPKPTKHQKSGKPDEGASVSPKTQGAADPEAKPREEANPGEAPNLFGPIMRPEGSQNRPATATRGRRKEPKTSPPAEPAAIAHAPVPIAEPAPAATPSLEAKPAQESAAPADAASGENAPVPRDNIPD
jgi:hypothetical protein